MAQSFTAHHVPLVRDYLTVVPAPAPSASPPGGPYEFATTQSFSGLVTKCLQAIVGTPMVAVVLSTFTSNSSSAVARPVNSIPGLTPSIDFTAAPNGVLSISGTPTQRGEYRLSVKYARTDLGVFAQTEHDIYVSDPADRFTTGATAQGVGQVNRAMSATLASPTLNYNGELVAIPNLNVPGCTISMVWTPGATSSGVLTISGTPTVAGVYTVGIDYRIQRCSSEVIGTSSHTITIAVAASPIPAPAPAPGAAPAPAPIPAPPAPPAPNQAAPVGSADPYFAQVKLLNHFNLADSDYATVVEIVPRGDSDSIVEVFGGYTAMRSAVGPTLMPSGGPGYPSDWQCFMESYFVQPSGLGFSYSPGLVADAPQSWDASLSSDPMTVECFVNLPYVWWQQAISVQGLMPIVSIVDASDAVVWSLGMLIQPFDVDAGGKRNWQARAYFARGGANPTLALSPFLQTPRYAYLHLAGVYNPGVSTSSIAVYVDGVQSLFDNEPLAAGVPWAPGHKIKIGERILSFASYQNMPVRGANGFPFSIDDARITKAARYTTPTIPLANRTGPWSGF